MNPKYVTSLGTSMKLKLAGVPQESEFYWTNYGNPNKEAFYLVSKNESEVTEIQQNFEQDGFKEEIYSAFLSDELGEMLSQYAISTDKCIWNSGIEKEKRTQYTPDGKELVEKEIVIVHTCSMFSADGKGFGWICAGGENDREAREKLLLYLIEQKLISFEAKASESEGV